MAFDQKHTNNADCPPSSSSSSATSFSGKNGSDVRNHVGRASYPTPQPLARILKSAIADRHGTLTTKTKEEDEEMKSKNGGISNGSDSKKIVEVESHSEGLAHLISNAFEAIDAVFFAAPPHVRKKPTFAHRLCLRVATDPKLQTLSITDLGSGMARADLINTLGIGRLSQRAGTASRALLGEENRNGMMVGSSKNVGTVGGTSTEEDDDDEEYEQSSSSEEEEDDDMSDASGKKTGRGGSHHSSSNGELRSIVVPCTKNDIGGFYAALCSLAVGVNVGTKSKFDDYYEFQIGSSAAGEVGKSEEDSSPIVDFSHFLVTRPLPEGTRPSAANGFAKFTDVRGECGTRVTLTLSAEAVAAGMLDENKVLKPIISKILETSEYSVAFSSNKEDVASIFNAFRREEEEQEQKQKQANSSLKDDEDLDIDDNHGIADDSEDPYINNLSGSHNTVKERSKYIPIRLSIGERKRLRLVEAATACCDYTSAVDRPFRSAARRTHAQLKGISSVLRGMVTALDYKIGQKLLNDEKSFSEYESFFQSMFEIVRRHKVMNPEKMRTEYGKLIYLLQDAVSPSVQPHLGFSCKGPINTVFKYLQDRNGLDLLDDKLIEIATQEILAEKKTRIKINQEIKRKERAVALLKQNYRNARLSAEDIHLCLYSICDNNSFLNSNRVPIDKIIGYLQSYFRPGEIEDNYSLSILSGKDGARLSHSHERQYYFALQSLTLWRDIVDDMFRLWYMAEEDLLSESVTYALKDTGQGMQRVQQSPGTYRAMQKILARVQSRVERWVGSSVIHLGDHNVPNALSFIDKYTQVPRILGPIVNTLENLERIYEEDDGIKTFVDNGFGGVDQLKRDILYDFFRSAFDGSGADNFYDAGSCIDGRLTSAWNWCSQLPTKPFYCVFKLTGFSGFDGEFK